MFTFCLRSTASVGAMGVGRGSKAHPCILKISAKKVVFLVSSGKNIFRDLCAHHLEKFCKNPPVALQEKFLPTPMVDALSFY